MLNLHLIFSEKAPSCPVNLNYAELVITRKTVHLAIDVDKTYCTIHYNLKLQDLGQRNSWNFTSNSRTFPSNNLTSDYGYRIVAEDDTGSILSDNDSPTTYLIFNGM